MLVHWELILGSTGRCSFFTVDATYPYKSSQWTRYSNTSKETYVQILTLQRSVHEYTISPAIPLPRF